MHCLACAVRCRVLENLGVKDRPGHGWARHMLPATSLATKLRKRSQGAPQRPLGRFVDAAAHPHQHGHGGPLRTF